MQISTFQLAVLRAQSRQPVRADVSSFIELEVATSCGPRDGVAARPYELDQVIGGRAREEDPSAPRGRLEAEVVKKLPQGHAHRSPADVCLGFPEPPLSLVGEVVAERWLDDRIVVRSDLRSAIAEPGGEPFDQLRLASLDKLAASLGEGSTG